MNLKRITDKLQFLTAFGLLFALLTGTSIVFAAPPAGGPSAEISVSGVGENGAKPSVKLNGEPALSGRTFFSQSTLETPAGVTANVNLPGLGRVSLSPGTMLSLGFSEKNISGKLLAGKIRVFGTAGTTVNIDTPDNGVVSNPAEAVAFTLDMTSGESHAVAESGSITMKNGEASKGQVQTAPAAANIWIPVTVFGAVVGTAVAVVLINRSDDDDRAEDVIVSPIT